MKSILFNNTKSKEAKAKSILLVDDSEPTNSFNKVVIKRNLLAEITTANNGLKALNHIELLLKKNLEVPRFILLDIDMPVMNGWEFLEAYVLLTPLYKNSKIIISTNAELNDADIKKIKKLNISDFTFIDKMISKESVQKLMF